MASEEGRSQKIAARPARLHLAFVLAFSRKSLTVGVGKKETHKRMDALHFVKVVEGEGAHH